MPQHSNSVWFNGAEMKNMSTFSVTLFVTMLGSTCAFGQEPIPVTKNYVAWAHEFLRTMYPALSGHQYAFTIETALFFDSPDPLLEPAQVYVGKRPTYDDSGSDCGTLSQPSIHPSSLPPGEPQADSCLSPQVLEGGFAFDRNDRLRSFRADGSAVRNLDAANAFTRFVLSHPEMTDADIAAALKKAGAKYGPDDKEIFIKDFPFTKLERFLGKLSIVSVSHQPLDENRNNLDAWPWWDVIARATQQDGTVITYNLTFDPFNADLMGCAMPNVHFHGN